MDIPEYTPLTPVGVDELVTAMTKAVSSSDELERMVFYSTGDRLYVDYVAPGKPLRATVFSLVEALEERHTTPLLLRRLLKDRPHRQDLKLLVARICPPAVSEPALMATAPLATQKAGAVVANGPASASAPGFERNIRPHLPMLDARVWMESFGRVQDRVCRVEIGGFPAGTGFLVGPDTVLTNFHVVESRLGAGASFDGVSCRFDYVALSDGGRLEGRTVGVSGCVDWSPYSPAEAENDPDRALPTIDELDYALLRLTARVGEETNHFGTNPRGWLALREDAPMPSRGAPLLIVQHPDGSPMKLTMDTEAVLDPAPNANGTRIRYATNTEPGSSGSPCSTIGWDLVALHHYGDPAWLKPKFNQGVPVGMIRQRIVRRGFGDSLGA